MDVTEVKKDPFRVFNKIVSTWRTAPEPFDSLQFLIRPMKTIERSEYNAGEREFVKSKDLAGAYARAGLTPEQVHADGAGIDLWRKVSDAQVVDIQAEIEFESVIRKMILACVTKVKSETEEREFTAEMYDGVEGNDLLIWLADQIKTASNLSESEVVGL